jgi:hypothetical protein
MMQFLAGAGVFAAGVIFGASIVQSNYKTMLNSKGND